jgi:hypothetical protein
VILLIASGSIFAGGQKEPFEFKYSVEDFQGTWQQVNGSSVITITGNDFTILNMEIGYAGYGIVSMGWGNKDKVKTEAIRFDFHNDWEGRSTKGNSIYLNMSEKDLNQFKRDRNYFVNDFQMKAWEDYSIPIYERNSIYPDDIFDKYFKNVSRTLKNAKYSKENQLYAQIYIGGGNLFYFELNGDNLKLIRCWDEELNNSDKGWHLWNLLFTGEFERVN